MPPPPPHLTVFCLYHPPKHLVTVPINKVDGGLRGANPVGVGGVIARHPKGGVGKGFGAEGGPAVGKVMKAWGSGDERVVAKNFDLPSTLGCRRTR